MPASAIPGAIDALVTALKAATNPRDVQVLDGPPNVDLKGDLIVVGLSIDTSEVDATHEIAGLQSGRQDFDVMCMTRSWSGSGDIAARRVRAFALLDAVQAVLTDDLTLGGAVTRARFTQVAYVPALTDRGPLVEIPFAVHIEAFNSTP
jgi:hypothetical protein